MYVHIPVKSPFGNSSPRSVSMSAKDAGKREKKTNRRVVIGTNTNHQLMLQMFMDMTAILKIHSGTKYDGLKFYYVMYLDW